MFSLKIGSHDSLKRFLFSYLTHDLETFCSSKAENIFRLYILCDIMWQDCLLFVY